MLRRPISSNCCPSAVDEKHDNICALLDSTIAAVRLTSARFGLAATEISLPRHP